MKGGGKHARQMRLIRDERRIALKKIGNGPSVVSGRGHEPVVPILRQRV